MTGPVGVFVAAAAGFALLGVLSVLLPRRTGSTWSSSAAVAVPVVAAAAVAWFAGPAPSGLAWADGVLRSTAAAAVSLLAARAGWRALVVGSLVAAVGAVDGSGVWPAGMAAGVAVGLATTGVAVPALKAGVGGAVAVAVAAFHLGWPHASFATAGLGAVALAVPAASGLVRLPRAPRRAAMAAAAGVVAVLAAAGGLGLAAAALARHDLEAGADKAQAGLEAARRGDVDRGARSLDEAHRAFADARGRLRAWWARPALAVPVVGHQNRALSTLASTGADIAEAGARLAEASGPGGFRVVDGRVPVERIRALHRPAERAFDVLTAAERDLRRARAPWLLPVVRREVDRLAGRVRRAAGEARVATEAARIAPALLGADELRRYFLAVQTPAELRATGGFIGSFAEIAADGGRLRLDRVGRTAELNQGGVRERRLDAPADYLARYGRFDPHLLWQNVTMSPDFPTVARVVAGLYPQSGGRPVDGVIAVDPYGLAAVLRAVGPIEVDLWPEPITADTAVPVLMYEQYVRFPAGDERVDFLGSVTQALWQRLVGSSVGVVDLARALADAVGEKHIMVASTRPDEQATLAGFGVAGAMAPVEDDFLGVVTQNASGNKIDWFLRRAVDYRVALDTGTGGLTASVRISLRNEAPSSGLPPYVIGNAVRPPLPTGTNRTYLSVYTPWLLRRASIDGEGVALESERELGRHVYSAYVDIPPDGEAVVELLLESEVAPTGPTYDLTLHRQPTAAADDVRVSVGGKVEQVQLTGDRTLSFPLPD